MTLLQDAKQAVQRYQSSFFSAKQPPAVDISHQVLLYVEGLSVSFDGFKALDDLNLYINDGELRCLIGANGAGKTTLMDVITGKTRPDTGDVYFGQTIDLLGLLEDKTRGNLTESEDNLLRNLLRDLRVHYVAKSESG